VEDRRFDAIARSLASGTSRRQVLKGLLGLGAGTVAVTSAASVTDAARRGYPGPSFPAPPGDSCTPHCPENYCGGDGCGGQCSCWAGWNCMAPNGTCGRQCHSDDDCSRFKSDCKDAGRCINGVCYDGDHRTNICDGSLDCAVGYVCPAFKSTCVRLC
jgi:hypothetical protein